MVLNNLAYLALEDNKLKQAEEMAKRAVALRPENAETKDTLAQIYIAKGQNEAALKLYDEIFVRPVSNDEVYLNHVELLLEMDKKPLAQRRLSSREFASQVSKDRVEALKTKYGVN
ncbi:tetratricopeptide repeat protein [Alteromonas gracilis]|uniref:tetratricopeptide repeat protein n=1 Tax=Alteromonas gracilis TaxID=1479524 RepID=UPI0030CBC963